MEDNTQNNPTAEARHLPFEFRGNAKEFFGIWIVNILLTMLTAGIYSAWAKVRTKRYFYGNTIVNNDRFDYLADPVTILKGWLIAVAFFIFYSVITSIFPLTIFIFMVVFIIALPWLVIKSLAFRAKNTTYKNIRFGFNQKYSEAIKIFVGLSLLIPLTLGLLYPYVIYRQQQFIVDNSCFGTTHFSFMAKIKDFYKIYAYVVLAGIIFSFIMYMGVMKEMGSIVAEINASAYNELEPSADLKNKMVFFQAVIMLGSWGFMLVAFGYLQARIQNLLWNNAEIDTNRFDSTLRARDIVWIYLTNVIAVIFSVGLLIPWTKIRLARYRMKHLALLAHNNLDRFIAAEEESVKAIGEEMGEVFDIDIGI